MIYTRLFTITILCVLSLGTGTTLAQITANEAAAALDSLQDDYVIGIADDSAAAFFSRLAGRFDILESRIESAGLRHSLIDIFDRSRYQRAWCYFRVGEANGDIDSFDEARLLFGTIRREAEDVEAVSYSTYMQGESRFWQGLLSKWRVMREPPFSEADLQRALDQLDNSVTHFMAAATDDQAPGRLHYAANLRLGDISYERAKVFQATENTLQTLESFESCRYRSRDVLRDANSGSASRMRDYSDAMRCLWRIFSDVDPAECEQTATASGVYDIAREGIFRQANLSHYSALTDTSLWSITDSLYGQAAGLGRVSEGLYWQGLVQSLKGEADATSLFEQFVREDFNENNLRLAALRDDAQRRIDLENETISADNAINFLRPGSDEYLVDQAIANAKYLIRRAASKITYWGRRPYLDKAGAFLVFADRLVNKPGFPDSGPKSHEINFYRQIVRFMAIPRFSDHLRRAQEFERVAQDLAVIGHDFVYEASYVRAISLYEAWSRFRVFGSDDEQKSAESMLSQARDIFEDLIRTHHSVRALYRLAEIYRIKDEDSLAAVTCYNTVIEKTEDCPTLSFFKGDCEAAIDQLPGNGGSTAQLAGLNYSQVRCPDYLVPGETVYWEGLSDDQGAMAVFAEESRQLLMQFALPRKNLYPTDRGYSRSVLLDDCFTGNEPFTAQVKDVLRLNPVWDLEVLVLREDGSTAVEDPRIRVTVPDEGNSAIDLNNDRFIRTDIPLGENIRAVFILDDTSGYYPEVKDYLSRDLRGWRVIDTVVLAAITRKYSSQVTSDAGGVKHLYRQVDNDVIVRDADDFPSGYPIEEFKRDVRLRDIVATDKDDGPTILYAHADSGVFTYSKGSDQRSQLGETHSRLTSPEGIAVDSKGYIYVADYGRDQVAVFDSGGREVGTIGTTGLNDTVGVLVWGHLALPTRVIIETDREGLTYNGATVRRADHILVADHYGLHRFDMLGYYLDSPLEIGNEWPTAGDLYGFDLTGYGRKSLLVVANRHDGKLATFAPSKK